MRRFSRSWSYFCLAWGILFAAGCANPGSGPDGGPYDETPPRLLGLYPELGATDVTKGRRVTFLFDENVKLDKPMEKVTISPPQLEVPDIKVLGRRITVVLCDTLLPATTYTIDFSDAIQDATEGNPMGNFTYYFSTGSRIDTMEVAGNVLAADNLEPVAGMLVGLYPADSHADSTFQTLPLARVARTDSRGRFSVKGVAPGSYRIYALKDLDGDFRWSRGEMLAFTDEVFTTSCFPDVRYDTAWVDSVRYDSIRAVPFTHYQPDDIILRAFQEVPTLRTLLKSVREVPERFTLYFTAPSPTKQIPRVEGFGFDAEVAFIRDCNETCDTVTYWIRDPEVAANDSLQILLTYDATNDSTYAVEVRTDTIPLIPRLTNARLAKMKAQEDEKWEKQLAKRHKKGDYTQEERPHEFLKLKDRGFSGALAPDRNPVFTADEPIVRLDTSAFHLQLRVDSLYEEVPCRIVQDGLRSFTLYGEWRPGQRYRLRVDSAAVEVLSGKWTDKIERNLSIVKMEDVGSVFVTLRGADTTAIVQLLPSEKKVERSVRAEGDAANFFYVKPGDYYLRLFRDRNGNGRWDTGNYLQGVQPEEVVYYPQTITVRADWDAEVSWDVAAVPPLQQKPAELRKGKSDARRMSARAKNLERERQRR
ncbi:MAG: Ig-like domain-containing protein [Alloprevotella sp.]|nr:Ig-like domain-containing protein [Alloprevotella sp.]